MRLAAQVLPTKIASNSLHKKHKVRKRSISFQCKIIFHKKLLCLFLTFIGAVVLMSKKNNSASQELELSFQKNGKENLRY